MMWLLLCLVYGAQALPSNFPASGNALWYTSPGNAQLWSTTMLPVGNGYLGAMLTGGTQQDDTQLNIESLWTGGPFQFSNYIGGNHNASDAPALHQLVKNFQQRIFSSPNGQIQNVSGMAMDPFGYGAFSGAGWLNVSRPMAPAATQYTRWLDLDQAVARTSWLEGQISLQRETFCSNPTQACIQRTTSSAPKAYSATYTLSPDLGLGNNFNLTCFASSPDTLQLRGTAGSPGMLYEILARIQTVPPNLASCAGGKITIAHATQASVIWVGDTEYNIDAGDAAHGFSFKGPDPHAKLLSRLQSITTNTVDSLLEQHIQDYTDTFLNRFSLTIASATPDLTHPTDALKAAYKTDVGNPFLELLTFNYGRYMLWSSSRSVLPANLQGKWAFDTSTPWSGDYHANINLQMNYWSAESTNLDVTKPLFDYMQKTWVPRGTQTAQVMYNSSGFTTHDEMNIFGHTGMKLFDPSSDAQWADYPMSASWMALHVWDHFDFTNDISWWKSQGYSLLKGVAQFNLDRLIPDGYFNDSTLVVAPCNSPEQPPVTFGCAHWQQLIWQVFNSVEKGFQAAGDDDTDFLKAVRAARKKLDTGIRIGSWGQLQEWKVDMDDPSNTHRHLSHLVGLYPGYAVANFDPTIQSTNMAKKYTRQQVLGASEISLVHRGNGTGSDADSGWEKVWRAACWAQLGNMTQFYHELSYALERDFAPNLFSKYNPFDPNPLFQIDANLGFPAAVMNGLLQAPDVPTSSTPLTITLLPSLPNNWAKSGSITSARVRGGITIDMTWANGRLGSVRFRVDGNAAARPVIVIDGTKGMTLASFKTVPGMIKMLV